MDTIGTDIHVSVLNSEVQLFIMTYRISIYNLQVTSKKKIDPGFILELEQQALELSDGLEVAMNGLQSNLHAVRIFNNTFVCSGKFIYTTKDYIDYIIN